MVRAGGAEALPALTTLVSGHLFVFISSRRTSIKCLFYDGTGLVILAKRMERGLFSRINPMYPGEITMTAAEFGLYFEGANLERRFICRPGSAPLVDSPAEIKKSFPSSMGLQTTSM